jgi:hypothetical protein
MYFKYFLNRCSNSIRCVLNQSAIETFKSNQKSGRNSKAAICLVRHHDGIIYNTGYNFNFNSSSMSKQNVDLASRIFSSNNNTINSNNNNKDNLTISLPKPSVKRHSMN